MGKQITIFHNNDYADNFGNPGLVFRKEHRNLMQYKSCIELTINKQNLLVLEHPTIIIIFELQF